MASRLHARLCAGLRVGGVEIAGIAQGRLEDLDVWKAEFSWDAVEGCSGWQAAHTVGTPQMHVLSGDPNSPGKFGLADAVSVFMGVDELDQARGSSGRGRVRTIYNST